MCKERKVEDTGAKADRLYETKRDDQDEQPKRIRIHTTIYAELLIEGVDKTDHLVMVGYITKNLVLHTCSERQWSKVKHGYSEAKYYIGVRQGDMMIDWTEYLVKVQ